MRVRDVRVPHIESHLGWRRNHIWQTRSRAGGKVETKWATGKTASGTVLYRDRGLLAAAFNRLIRLGVLDRSPVALVAAPKRRKRARRYLAKEHVPRLLAACGSHLRPLVLFGFFGGPRPSELILPRWRDSHLSGDRPTISFDRPKTENAGVIPLHPVLVLQSVPLVKVVHLPH